MAEGKLLTVREVSSILNISEKEVLDLVENNRLEAYKVGGVYLRFRPQKIEEFKKSFKPQLGKAVAPQKDSFRDWVSDFFYFNDFYILSALIIALILVIIFQG